MKTIIFLKKPKTFGRLSSVTIHFRLYCKEGWVDAVDVLDVS
jgi:hypothetical protein